MTDHLADDPPRHAAEPDLTLPGVERRTADECPVAADRTPARDLIVSTLLPWHTGDGGMVAGPVEELADALVAALRSDSAALRALLLDGF